jgi:hypothetical protein
MGSPAMWTHETTELEAQDVEAGFECAAAAQNTYFARHALANAEKRIGQAYVLRRREGDPAGWPAILGFYTLSMASTESAQIAAALRTRLPRYPMPVGLIGQLARHKDAVGGRLGELLLFDAIARILGVADTMGCMGIIVDSSQTAESFYLKYQFEHLTVGATTWPRRMFLPLATAKAAFDDSAPAE